TSTANVGLSAKKFCEMVRIPHKPTINYAQTAISDEIQKRSDLRWREVARGMIGIERIEFFRPFRQDLNKLASRQQRRQADREALENPLARHARCYRNGRIIQH